MSDNFEGPYEYTVEFAFVAIVSWACQSDNQANFSLQYKDGRKIWATVNRRSLVVYSVGDEQRKTALPTTNKNVAKEALKQWLDLQGLSSCVKSMGIGATQGTLVPPPFRLE